MEIIYWPETNQVQDFENKVSKDIDQTNRT